MEYTTCKDSVMELISDGSKVFDDAKGHIQSALG